MTTSARITWLGHATVLLDIGGTRLLTDPVLRPRVLHLRRHARPPARLAGLDAVLISHLHHDHLDLRTLRKLPPAPVVVPSGGGALIRRVGREPIEVTAGDEVQLRGATVRAVAARHAPGRPPLRRAGAPLGYVVEGPLRVYFAGDTALFDGMADIGARSLDAALLPVWGWGSSLGPGHLDPEDAARALVLLRPGVAVPIHWGTFLPLGLARRHGHLLREPGVAFSGRAAVLAPEVRVVLLAPGESLEMEPRAGGA